ncbi:DnaJ domain-containing protein [Myxococcota bacterium]|nr:DnaJ domain-containing protein [Myxococcota bacterium]
MAEDPNIHPLWAAETKQIAATLDQLDYFQVLGADPSAPLDVLKAQYHALQRNYHPDTFFQSPDTELRAAVMKISKRVAEAYVILRDADKRAKYVRDISGPERAKKLRFTEQSEMEAKREKEEELGKTPQVRQLVSKASQAVKAGDLASAARDLKTALLFERNNELIKKRLEEVEAELKAKGGPAKPAGPKPPGR